MYDFQYEACEEGQISSETIAIYDRLERGSETVRNTTRQNSHQTTDTAIWMMTYIIYGSWLVMGTAPVYLDSRHSQRRLTLRLTYPLIRVAIRV